MKICAKCQLNYDDKFTFCKKCGGKLEPYQHNIQENSEVQKLNDKPEEKVSNKVPLWNNTAASVSSKSIIFGSIILLVVLLGVLNSDNVSNCLIANKAMSYDITYTERADSAIHTIQNRNYSSYKEYMSKREELWLSLDEMKKYRDEYNNAHQNLVNNNSVLQHFDHIALSLSSGSRYSAFNAMDAVLKNGGTWEEAQKAYDEKR